MYVRLCNDLADKGKLLPDSTNVIDYISNKEKDHYVSVFKYSEDHKRIFDESKSIAGITDVTTNLLIWDFDNEKDLEVTRQDALELCDRLEKLGISNDAIQVYFSGGKGFHVVVQIYETLNPTQLRRINFTIAKGLSTNDQKICNASRIIRVPYTKHPKTKLYKIGMHVEDLLNFTTSDIQKFAESLNNIEQIPNFSVAYLPEVFKQYMKEEPKVEIPLITPLSTSNLTLDYSNKPKWLDEARWALQNGYFEEGERSHAFLCLAATYKNQGFDLEHTYRFLKGVATIQAKRTGMERFPDEQLYNNVCVQVYGPHWKGGQYTTRDPGSWLHMYSIKWGIPIEKKDSTIVNTDQVFGLFENYATNYEKNALKTGIKSLDEKCSFMVGTSNGILAPPGVGKTSFISGMLNTNSKLGIKSILFSYDMFHAALLSRLAQKHSGLTQEAIFKLVKSNSIEVKQLKETLREEYKNVSFCFKSGQTADDIEQTIIDTQEKTGEKVKLVVVDYSELVITSVSDPTQASALVSQRLRQIANDREVCIVTLYQPNKANSNMADEITSYSAAKGSSSIAQSATLILGMNRPGFSPRNPENDRFLTISALKNRNGGLFTVDLGWNGLKGEISELSFNDKEELEVLRARIKELNNMRQDW